jgi:glycosyltransferase involved in cell wall biosynthesis
MNESSQQPLSGEHPFFSVIIPSYNCAQFLREALQSLNNQTFQDFDVHISDSHSTDGTDCVPQEFPNLRCTVHTNDRFGNIAASRNLAASHATAPWLAFLDADDFWTPDKLARIKESIVANPEAVIFCHAEHIFQDGKIISDQYYSPRGDHLPSSLIFGGNAFSTAATVLRRDIFEKVGGFDDREDLITAEDYNLWICVSPYGEAVFLKDILGYYRLHGSNSSAKLKRHLDATEAVLLKHLAPYRARHAWAVNRRMFRFTGRCAIDILRHKHWIPGAQYALKAAGYALCMAVSWRPGVQAFPHSPE